MRNYRKLGAPLVILGLLSGCASAGNSVLKRETAASIDLKIKDGVTTQAEVRNAFGDPLHTSFTDSGHLQWVYTFDKMHVTGSDFIPIYGDLHKDTRGKRRELIIIFDGDKVWHHNFSVSSVHNTVGLW